MKKTAPHYLLITEAKTIIDPREDDQATSRRSGHWRFVLEQMGVEARIEVADEEPNVFGERLQLLAVVRGLESLEQPSRVTLLTSSRYVGQGIRQGMSQWRSNQWRWERFGKMTLIKDHDLWRRVDHALQFHSLECRIWDLSRLTPHTAAASTSPNFPTAFPTANSPFTHRPSLSNPRIRRSNVIRPHGDRSATDRKPIQPLGFSTQNADAEAGRDIIRVRDTSPSKSANLESAEPDVEAKRQKPPCENQQLKNCADQINSMARVKPPRAGRAYGYAVN